MNGMLQGKAIIVTGAAGGIGSVVSELFAREGARVLVSDIDEAGVEAVARRINDASGQAIAMRVDTTKAAEVEAMVKRAVEAFGRIDCALNNVGIAVASAPVADLTQADFEKGLNVNVIGTWLCMKYEIPRMIEAGGGSIVNMASLAGVLGVPHMAIYSASKHAVNGLTKSAAAELGLKGIRVNAICPGSVSTAQRKAMLAAAGGPRGRNRNPNAQDRPAEPDEVGELALWLLSDRSSHITGQTINIDGGQSAAVHFLHEFEAD